jgi:hypothetical protein
VTEKTYIHTDLDCSTDDMLTCATCGVDIVPDSPMIYFVRLKEGFAFHHEGVCAREARREVYGP